MKRDTTRLRPLREAVASHVGDRALSDEQLDSLLALQPSGRQRFRSRLSLPRWRPVALAAMLLLGVFAGFFAGRAPTPSQQLERIVEEAVQNHVLHMPLEVVASRVADTRAYFHRLRFDVTEPARAVSNAALLGGRYCSLQGSAAAQLRYGLSDTDYVTLYQVPLEPSIAALLPATRSVTGRRAELWREGDLLLVRVEGPANP